MFSLTFFINFYPKYMYIKESSIMYTVKMLQVMHFPSGLITSFHLVSGLV